jgi:diphthine-ammonia ligase
MNISCSWSGGKDSCYALMLALRQQHTLKALVNMMNESGVISRSHGLPIPVLQQQADALRVPLIAQPTSWNEYQSYFISTLEKVKTDFSVEAMVFGDIDLQEHRDWEEMVCAKAQLLAMLPIWKRDRKQLVQDMLDEELEAIIVSCNTQMGERFLGETLSPKLVMELETLGVDVCGENGEFHTVVVNCPIFARRIQLPQYGTVLNENYWFLRWQL